MPRTEDKKRIVAQAAEFMKVVKDDGDWTEALAALYAAAQVIERQMQIHHRVGGRWLDEIQLTGRRIGAGIDIHIEFDVVGNEDVQ